MLLQATSPLLDDWTGEANITTEHRFSCFGRPMLLIEGEAIGPDQADWPGYEVLEATNVELEALRRGYYHFDVEQVRKHHRRRRYAVNSYER